MKATSKIEPAKFWTRRTGRRNEPVEVWRTVDGRDELIRTLPTMREALAYMRSLPGYVQAYAF